MLSTPVFCLSLLSKKRSALILVIGAIRFEFRVFRAKVTGVIRLSSQKQTEYINASPWTHLRPPPTSPGYQCPPRLPPRPDKTPRRRAAPATSSPIPFKRAPTVSSRSSSPRFTRTLPPPRVKSLRCGPRWRLRGQIIEGWRVCWLRLVCRAGQALNRKEQKSRIGEVQRMERIHDLARQ
ncbi:hypothetical protein B0H12DRAFT_327466 [Mycena haematopus]|nr:hypothetical protein B0H12DRAFT_327466 [Mycena haematopus]